ncbi:helix-turn-helix transcriptional regulator [Micromonospora coerulea]|uniref:helix-turn-helix transcriptional regulator n=1 Tax=Micromonospora coerulea TaxID=47856 RepID=UPI0019070934|nr:LuxR family transcriptional regulator [Micromonospora veneta]
MQRIMWGREPELAVLRQLVTGLPDHGGVLVVRGGAGIGKSSLLTGIGEEATGRGIETLTLEGVQAEWRLPFAAAHTLLGQLGVGEPPAVGGSVGHYQFQLSLALLDALTTRSAHRPLLILVDDAQWLDTPSWEALAFVGRRLTTDPVALILAMRDGPETEARLAQMSVAELQVEPLSEEHSLALLDEWAPNLDPRLRARILAEAAGNPLALGELAAAVTRAGETGLLPSSLPLTTRLERTFGLSIAEMPVPTRALLLVAALDDSDRLGEIMAAATLVAGVPLTVEDVEPAIAARLVDVNDSFQIRFRHPLVRSAIRQEATVSQRQQAHTALARVTSDPERAVRHRAAATVGTDERVADEVDQLAARLGQRGAAGAAAPLWARAAQLTGDVRRRASLLLRALEMTLEVADHEGAAQLLRAIVPEDLSAEDQVVLQLLREVADGGWSGSARLPTHIAAAEGLRRSGHHDCALDVLFRVALRGYFSNLDQELRDEWLALLDRLDPPALAPRLVATLGLIAPVERGALVVERLAALLERPNLSGIDLTELAAGATAVGALGAATRLAAEAVALNRQQGNLISLTWALTYQAWNAVALGDASLARAAAAEADALAGETRQRSYLVPNTLNHGHAEALRGNSDRARAMADECERVLLSNGAHTMLALVRVIRGVAALADGRYAEAHDELDAIFDPSSASYHPYVRFSVIAHLAEAGAHCDRHDQVAARIRELEPIDAAGPSPLLRVALRCARALVAPDDQAEAALRATLGTDLTAWPFERSRLQLAYGTRLRRRQPAAARSMLRSAADTFDALGARPWADRAQRELRASGETRRRPADGIDQLTPQELQVARLVAQGLSNRDIAGRLFVSPRTVSTHLYRIYPKLGVASRASLAAVMARSHVI